jgi:hypothetical protein
MFCVQVNNPFCYSYIKYHLILNESCFLIENRAQNGKQSQLITNLRLKLTAVTVYKLQHTGNKQNLWQSTDQIFIYAPGRKYNMIHKRRDKGPPWKTKRSQNVWSSFNFSDDEVRFCRNSSKKL